jgi:hypothetical protein
VGTKFGVSGVVKGGVVREYTNGTSQDQLFVVCSVQDDNGGALAQNANARLIAAAPDLLAELRKARAALKEQLEILIQSHSDPKTGLITDDADLRAIESDQDLINGIDRVIDKAEGGAA